MPRPFKRKRSKFDDIRDERRKARAEATRENALRKRRKLEQAPDHDDEVEISTLKTEFESSAQGEPVFFGLLDPEEQAYYANVNNKIASNDFENDQERQEFLEAIYRESDGKEIKLASSQSCSRHLERIILVSTPEQLMTLFGKLLAELLHLAQHRFGSHVLETLFVQSAPHVVSPQKKARKQDGVSTKLESLFVEAALALQPNIGYLLTDRFGSHVVRILLLVLTGEPLDLPETRKMLASKKKEHINPSDNQVEPAAALRPVPDVFTQSASDLIKTAVDNLDSTSVRALATHPTGNPTLQLLLKLELLGSDKGRTLGEDSIFHKLFSPNSLDADSEGAKLVSGLTYDSTGSHLVEIVIQHAPGRIFKKLFQGVWKAQLPSMAKNDVASYVAVRIMERLGKDDLREAQVALMPHWMTLLERRRFTVIQTLIDRSVVRGVDLKTVLEALKTQIGDGGKDLLRELFWSHSGADDAGTTSGTEGLKSDKHSSLLAQSLLQAPDVSIVIRDSLLATEIEIIVAMSKDPSASRVLQVALTSSNSPTAFRRQLIPRFYNHLSELATDRSGSYVVEALWDGTSGLHFMKERIASELAQHESELRESIYGRNVWRNWLMDLYSRRRGEWAARAKGLEGK